jgi:hypothetical protein
MKQVVEWATEQIGFHKREIGFVDDWDPERHELRQFSMLRFVDDAESGEECFREVEGGMAHFVKLDRRRRLRHGFAEIDVMNAYALSDGEEAEEESMEVDEEALPPVATVSAAMARGQVGDGPVESYTRDKFYAWWWRWKHCSWWPGKRWSKGCQVRVSNSRNHVASWLTLFGPRASHAASQDGDWDDMDEILKQLPVTGGQRALVMQNVALFDPVILKEYLKIHLSSLYPGEPDMCWDYPAWWTRSGRHGFTVFSGILIRGMYLGNWGTFVEHGSSTST